MTGSDRSGGNAFGAKFGRLVRSYREDIGLSARDLAIRVWNDEARKSSISRLENGRVGRPAAETVQKIALALDIPQEEIDGLRAPSADIGSVLSQHLGDLARSSRDQLEALAARFEIDRAYDRSSENLRQLLEAKADEYRAYRRKIDLLDERQDEIVAARAAANAAADRLDLDECEHQLLIADRLQTLLFVETKEARASYALLRGQVDKAFELFRSAADALRTVDSLETARRLKGYFVQLYDHGLLYGNDGLALSVDMARHALAAFPERGEEWAQFLMSKANALANLGDRTEGGTGTALLEEAVGDYQVVLTHFGRTGDRERSGVAQHNLGGALCLLADRADATASRIDLLEKAIGTFRVALEVRDQHASPREWAMTMQNLAVALRDLGAATEDEVGRRHLMEAVEICERSLAIRTKDSSPFEWAMTQENLAQVRFALANHRTTNDPSPHLAAAESHIDAALTVYSLETSPYYFDKATEFRRVMRTARIAP
ncbi:helix-turn-helix domain-containing protein [Histidinibacterium aquaticum]|uniref:Helix-turn-helix transcriptional regulator n=1 Tax=Histidinibacterium aquaticum TaxID=2613962 RepID=A0A5J5GA88_9RHOB|nr:helix-turn-helix transcriptional regulator [Histidinibacterium aquaticum]KAA9005069.1 helix-turn-helix transcriptional regulator [Histidinibacterium aquaticum]